MKQTSSGTDGSQSRDSPQRTTSTNPDQSIAAMVQEGASAASSAVRRQAAEVGRNVAHEVEKSATDQKAVGSEALRTMSRAITAAASEMEGASPDVARWTREVAQKVDGLSSGIEGRSFTDIWKEAEDLARTQPVVFFGAALAAGFGISRFLTATGQSDSQTGGQGHASS